MRAYNAHNITNNMLTFHRVVVWLQYAAIVSVRKSTVKLGAYLIDSVLVWFKKKKREKEFVVNKSKIMWSDSSTHKMLT